MCINLVCILWAWAFLKLLAITLWSQSCCLHSSALMRSPSALGDRPGSRPLITTAIRIYLQLLQNNIMSLHNKYLSICFENLQRSEKNLRTNMKHLQEVPDMKWRHNGCVVQLQTVPQSSCSGCGPDHENTIILLGLMAGSRERLWVSNHNRSNL